MKLESSKLIIIISVIISIYFILLISSDIEKITISIASIDKMNLMMAVGMWCFGVVLRITRWHFFLKSITTSIPLKPSILYYLAGYALIISPARAGEVIRSPFIMRDYGIPISKTAPLVFVERFYDLLALTLIIGVGLIFSNFEKSIIVLPLGLVAIVIIMVKNKKLLNTILSRLSA